jgi:excisionase family DNA binding protein
MLTYAELAAELNVPIGTLYSLKSRGELPFVQLGRRLIRFPADQIEKWLEARAVLPSKT